MSKFRDLGTYYYVTIITLGINVKGMFLFPLLNQFYK
jgi:hypothetical protein